MNEDIFWEIIALFDWDKTGDDEAVMQPAIERLSSMNIEDIYEFDNILSEKLFKLDGIAYASNIGEESYRENGEGFSVDYFLYVRCCVVANGRNYFNKVLADPTMMPKDMDFEALLYLAREAYNKKLATDDYDHEPRFDYETFNNKDGWTQLNEKQKKPRWKFW